MSASEPGKIITPWAESGLKNPIPPAANPATGRAGFDQGFSPINMTAKEAGGIPPFGQDFNGIFYEVTNILRYMQAGGQPTFDADLAAAIGGYPKGAMVLGSDGVSVYTNIVDSNSSNPNSGGSGWARDDLILREALRRSYAEAGYDLIGDFSDVGLAVTTVTDVVVWEPTGIAYAYGGTLPHAIGAVETPIGNPLWVAKNLSLLRSELSIKTLETFGATGGADDTAAMNAANGSNIQITDKIFTGNPYPFTNMGMAGRIKSVLKQKAATGNFLSFFNCQGGTLSGLTIESNKGGVASAQGHQVAAKDGGNLTFENLNFEDVEGSGFSLITYPDTQVDQRGFIIRSIRGKYNPAALDQTSGCVLLALNKLSIVDGVIASGYAQFGAVELKDDATHNSISNVIAENCDTAVYLGTETAVSPSKNIFTALISKDPRSSCLNLGLGSYNIAQGLIADFTNSEATQPYGITTDGNGNALNNIMYLGVDGTAPISGDNQVAYPVRFRGAARNNYASLYAHHTSQHLTTFDAGTTRNFVELKHPGERSDIFSVSSAIGDKTTITGDANSNVFHAPALGQYFGTMSGRFEWRIKDVGIPAGTIFSGDKFRFIDSGAPSLVVGGGTAAQFKLFLSDGTFRTLNLASNQTLRMDTGSGNYIQFGAAALTPNTANTYSLGGASLAWAGGFTQTAFTVTSDERHKTSPLEISDAILDAWSEVDFVSYQYLDRVEEKGADGARWHLGVVAQRAKEAFERHGLDAHDYGFFCYDQWDAAPAEYREITKEEHDAGEYPTIQTQVLVSPAVEAGDKYGIRYEEVLALEAALQRRNYQRLLARVEALEAK